MAPLVLGFVLVLAAIWRLFLWASAPPQIPGLAGSSSALTTSSASGAAGAAKPPRMRSSSTAAPPLALLSASAAVDATAALGAFQGRVVSSATGRGIGGARLVLEHAGVATEIACATDGSFRFLPAAAGTYALVHAAADGYLAFAPAPAQSPIQWTARPGARVDGFVLALDPATAFVIEVQSPDGKPVAGAEVRVLGDESGAVTAKTTTDAQGQVQMPLADDALVEARHHDFAPGRTRVTLNAEASHELKIRLRAKGDGAFGATEGNIAGRVVDTSGAAVAGARLVAVFNASNRAAAGADLHPGGTDESDADGTFRIEGLDEGTYELTASDDEHAAARMESVATGAQGLVLTLGSGGAIQGTVRDAATGKPIAAFSVVLSLARGALEKEHVATRSFLDAEGRYEIEGLGPGSYEVVAVALGLAPSPAAETSVADPPGAPVTVDLTLARGARLRGNVLDVDTQKPLAGARIALEGALGAGSAQIPLLATAASGADGSFELSGLAMGTRSLTVTATGHHGRIVSGITVGSVEPPPITVALTPTEPGEEPGIELVGIGAVLAAKDDALVVGQVLPGGGAAEAGLVPGDGVLAIDGNHVTELGFEGSIQKIRGPEGSSVALLVRKAGATEATEVVVWRRRIKG